MKLGRTRQKKLCPNCNREIQVANFNRHYTACVNGYKNKVKNKILYSENLICPFCDQQFDTKNRYAQHYIRCSKNPDRIKTDSLSNYIINNRKGKNKYNCEDVAKQTATLKSKYENGYINPCRGVSTKHDYVYQEQNQDEINKWLEYISSIEINNNYETIVHNEGYKIISRGQVQENNSIKLTFEHNYVANVLLDNKLDKDNCVHHINEDRADNNKNNLLIFIDHNNHKRFHNSKYAKLVYNQETHLFSCYIDKPSAAKY